MQAKYRISESAYVSAMKLYGRLTLKMLIIYSVVVGILILAAIFGTTLFRAAAIGGSVVVIIGGYIVNPMLARRQYKQYKAIHDEFSISLSDDALCMNSSNAKGILPWSDILKWRENDNFLLLYLMPRLYYIVPKSISQNGFDIELLVKALNENVGEST